MSDADWPSQRLRRGDWPKLRGIRVIRYHDEPRLFAIRVGLWGLTLHRGPAIVFGRARRCP